VAEHEYTRTRPSLTQRIVLRLMRSRAEEIERQTKEWIVVCPNCELERTFWDIGAVRYGARRRGKGFGIGMRCPRCRQRGMHPVSHRPGDRLEIV
jgi:hypothetical protein